MDMFDFDSLKAEKVKAIFQYNLLKTMQTFFRVTELFLFIVLVSWTSFHLPFALKICGEYLRLLISIIVNPFSIFLIGNIIVLCLLFKSRISINYDKDDKNQEYFTGNSFLNPINGKDEMDVLVAKTEEVFYDDKETIYEEDKTARISLVTTSITGNNEAKLRVLPYEEHNNVKVLEVEKNEIVKVDEVEKNLRRSKSENSERVVKISGKLRRSETEKCRRILNLKEEEEVHVFDELSNEEFQNAIDAFIAKQMKFHEAEKHVIVLQSQA